jgi:hypothetical protein
MEALRTKGGQPIWKDDLCTSYLASRLPGVRIDAVLKRTKVKIRLDDVKESFVMVSCGTGIAPIRSLLWHVSGFSFDSVPAFLKHVIWLEEGGYGSRAVPVHALLVSVTCRLANTVDAGGPLGRVIREGCGPVWSS